MRTALTVLVADAAEAAAAHASAPQITAKTDSNGRIVPLMVPNSTARRSELQALFPLLSVGCNDFIERNSKSRAK